MLAPICLFTYNRPEETRKTIEALQLNNLAARSDLVVFSDGPKNEKSYEAIKEVREYLRSVSGFKSIKIIESEVNQGLANSIIKGVTQIIEEYGKVIVLEDDLITAPNFLDFMNFCLQHYFENKNVFSVSGFSVRITFPSEYIFDIYYYKRPHSWGWATWQDRWETVDWSLQDFHNFRKNRKEQREFNKLGTDLTQMLMASNEKRIDSWYVRFAFNQFKQKKITIFPSHSKVINNGFMENSTHCKTYNRVKISFDSSNKTKFLVPETFEINEYIRKQVFKYKSLSFRIIGRILTELMKFGIIKQRKHT